MIRFADRYIMMMQRGNALMTSVFDVAIVGSGPVGQHAALKCALLNMTAVIIDKGRRHCRAFFVPSIANIPTMPGVSGRKLLELQRDELANQPAR
jgi:thioredoxin reductase